MPDTATPTTTTEDVTAAIEQRWRERDAADRRLVAVACHRLVAIILEAHPEAESIRFVRGRYMLHLGDVRFSEDRRLRFWRVNLLANDEVASLEGILGEHARMCTGSPRPTAAAPVWASIIDEAGWVDLAQLATVAP